MELFFFSAMVYQLYYLHQLIGFFFFTHNELHNY